MLLIATKQVKIQVIYMENDRKRNALKISH